MCDIVSELPKRCLVGTYCSCEGSTRGVVVKIVPVGAWEGEGGKKGGTEGGGGREGGREGEGGKEGGRREGGEWRVRGMGSKSTPNTMQQYRLDTHGYVL